MTLYAESSAVLAWLLAEPAEASVREALAGAECAVSSALTAVEVARALARHGAHGRLRRAQELAALRLFDEASAQWTTLDVSADVLTRAKRRFSIEPVRTLDAIHLASLSVFSEVLPDLYLLSLDDRVRANAAALGVPLLPAAV